MEGCGGRQKKWGEGVGNPLLADKYGGRSNVHWEPVDNGQQHTRPVAIKLHSMVTIHSESWMMTVDAHHRFLFPEGKNEQFLRFSSPAALSNATIIITIRINSVIRGLKRKYGMKRGVKEREGPEEGLGKGGNLLIPFRWQINAKLLIKFQHS